MVNILTYWYPKIKKCIFIFFKSSFIFKQFFIDWFFLKDLLKVLLFFSLRCFCGRLVKQHACFTASLAMKYSDVKLGDHFNQTLEEWSVEKHTEQSPTDAYGVINFQGGSHSYRAKVYCVLKCLTSFTF